MRRLPVVLALVLATILSGCKACPRVYMRPPQPATAYADTPQTAPPEKAAPPTGGWIAEHPVTTCFLAGACGALAVVGALVVLASLAGPGMST